MAIGDVKNLSCTINGQDFGGGIASLQIIEDMSAHGPKCNVKLIDGGDAMKLIQGGGKDKLKINFGSDSQAGGGETVGAEFSLMRSGFENMSSTAQSSSKNKEYFLDGIPQAYLQEKRVRHRKSYHDTTANIVKDVAKECYGFDDVKIESQTKGKHTIRLDHYGQEALDYLSDKHYTGKEGGGICVLYHDRQNGKMMPTFKEVEQMMGEGPVASLTGPHENLDAQPDSVREKSILSVSFPQVTNSLLTPYDQKAMNRAGYNLTTGQLQPKEPVNGGKTTVPGRNIESAQVERSNSYRTFTSSQNMKEKTNVEQSRGKKLSYSRELSENYMNFECVGNPNIKVGKIVDLQIPQASAEAFGKKETQMNGKFLVTEIVHNVRPKGQTPRYMMSVRVIKASFDQGGGGGGGAG